MINELQTLVSLKPRHVIRWGRADVIEYWIGRTVSVKIKFKGYQDPFRIGTIVEVGPSGWVGVLWETGLVSGHWNRRELDNYQGEPYWKNRAHLLKNPTAYEDILLELRSFPRDRLQRYNFSIDYICRAPHTYDLRPVHHQEKHAGNKIP